MEDPGQVPGGWDAGARLEAQMGGRRVKRDWVWGGLRVLGEAMEVMGMGTGEVLRLGW